MNGGSSKYESRKPGLKPWFAISILGHVLLIGVVGLLGLRAAPEVAERLPFHVGLVISSPREKPPDEPASPVAQEPVPAKPAVRNEPVQPRAVRPEPADFEDEISSLETQIQPPSAPVFEVVESSPVMPIESASSEMQIPSIWPVLTDMVETSAPSAPATVPGPDLLAAYLERISALVDGAKRYPPLAARKRLEGRVLVAARLDSSGGVLEARVVDEADPLLSEAALGALKRAAPFGPLPGGRETLEVSVPVRFLLTR